MNTSKQCRIDSSSGQLFSILFKENDFLATDTINDLVKHFDMVIVSPATCNDIHSQLESCDSVEVMALRKKRSDEDSESSDIGAILDAMWPEGSGKKAILRNITDGLQIHEVKCDRGLE